MVAVKITDEIKSYLADSKLVVWEARKDRISKDHPWRFQVRLAGPGIDAQPWGHGDSLEAAVDDALRNTWFQSHRPGLIGAMARLEMELRILDMTLMSERLRWNRVEVKVDHHGNVYYQVPPFDPDLDDDVPF